MTPDQRKHTRFIIRRYLERCEVAKPQIHYSQHRPITSYGDSPERGFTTDCSGLVCSAYYAADLVCPLPVKNPGGYPYAMRQGWTGSILAENRTRRVPPDHKYFIGDMALFGPNLVRTPGTSRSAVPAVARSTRSGHRTGRRAGLYRPGSLPGDLLVVVSRRRWHEMWWNVLVRVHRVRGGRTHRCRAADGDHERQRRYLRDT